MPGSSEPERRRLRHIAVTIGLMVACFSMAVACLPYPGMAVDEMIYLPQSKWYVHQFRTLGLTALSRENVHHIFRGSSEHPPLGRLIIGLTHWLGDPEPGVAGSVDRIQGRLAGAISYAVLVGAVYALMAWQVGTPAGLVAAGATALCPRLFGHAQLISLDVIAAAFWFLALLSYVWALSGPSKVRAALAGIVFGLAMLVKMQALLLPVILIPWGVWRQGRRGLIPAAIWGAVALAVFFLGWPWIWYDTVPRLRDYLASGVRRAPIFVTYFGQKYADSQVPWTYPFVMTGLTVPVTTWVLALVGAVVGVARREPIGVLASGGIVVLLGLFAVPGVPVYDGTRHFLAVFPLVACLAGLTVQWGWHAVRSAGWARWLLGIGVGVLTLAPGWHLYSYFPCHLSYYNVLVGGLPGAERCGLETTYWGESVDEQVLGYVAGQARRGDRVALAPLLLDALRPIYAARRDFFEKNLRVVPFQPGQCEWLVVFPRHAYLEGEAIRHVLASQQPVWQRQVHGVSLARVYHLARSR